MSDERKIESEQPADAVAEMQVEAENGDPSVEPQSELVRLREEIDAKAQEAKQNYDRFVRQTAELENFKKRAIRDKEEGVRLANEALVRDLLPVVDNLERAVAHAKSCGEGESLVEGVEMVLKGLLDAFVKHGVVQISAVGEQFDPKIHEAIAQVESADNEPNTVLEEHQKGYLLKDRLLRPALVTVVKALKSKDKKNETGQVENGRVDD